MAAREHSDGDILVIKRAIRDPLVEEEQQGMEVVECSKSQKVVPMVIRAPSEHTMIVMNSVSKLSEMTKNSSIT